MSENVNDRDNILTVEVLQKIQEIDARIEKAHKEQIYCLLNIIAMYDPSVAYRLRRIFEGEQL